jgi:cupin superfamily acireductone dioxygenase involved in methionine salvage
MSPKKIKESDEFENHFKDMIKGIIREEGYIKDEELKNSMTDLLTELDPLIAKYVKNHFREIGYFIINSIEDPENQISPNSMPTKMGD